MSGYRESAEEHAAKSVEEARAATRHLIAEEYSDYGAAAALDIAVEQLRGMVVETRDAECGA